MIGPIPYPRVTVTALASVAVAAYLLHRALRDWVAALHLAIVLVFAVMTLVLAVHAMVVAIIRWVRRNRDDPPGHQRDFDLVA
jgi:hypothetical protein